MGSTFLFSVWSNSEMNWTVDYFISIVAQEKPLIQQINSPNWSGGVLFYPPEEQFNYSSEIVSGEDYCLSVFDEKKSYILERAF